jgi:phosphodiesterase/alkaline phosphatase D-like protein
MASGRTEEFKGKFKIIASGSVLHHSKVDGWRIFTFSRHRLFDAIKKHKISGVMYIGGDMHQSLVWQHHESDRVGYPMIEIMSSGITNGKDLSFATIDFDTSVDDPPPVSVSSMVREKKYTLIRLGNSPS